MRTKYEILKYLTSLILELHAGRLKPNQLNDIKVAIKTLEWVLDDKSTTT